MICQCTVSGSKVVLVISLVIFKDIFVSLSQVDGMYFVCNIDEFKFLADMIQHIPLYLRSRYVFCTAPINKKQPFLCTSFLKVPMSWRPLVPPKSNCNKTDIPVICMS